MTVARWRLVRNCSLTPRQALGAWSIPVATLLGVAAFAAAQRWWWVLGFALLDAAGLAVALWRYARHALDGETLQLDDDGMLHIDRQRGGMQQRTSWRASMVRLDGGAGQPITLWAGRERLTVGREAPPHLRELTVRELRRALRPGAAARPPAPAAAHPTPGS